jgi:hypothetical protein
LTRIAPEATPIYRTSDDRLSDLPAS